MNFHFSKSMSESEALLLYSIKAAFKWAHLTINKKIRHIAKEKHPTFELCCFGLVLKISRLKKIEKVFCIRQSRMKRDKERAIKNVNMINMCHFSLSVSLSLEKLSVLLLLPSADDTSKSMLLQKCLNIFTSAVKLQVYIFYVINVTNHNILLLGTCIFSCIQPYCDGEVSYKRVQRSLYCVQG